jgi:hypothetical protein
MPPITRGREIDLLAVRWDGFSDLKWAPRTSLRSPEISERMPSPRAPRCGARR